MVGASSDPNSLKEYLKKYTSNDDKDKDKKKKKKRKAKPNASGVIVVDEDPVWQKPVNVEDEEDSADEEKPLVDEDIDVKRMRRLEQVRSKRPFGVISEDGSGWVPLSTNPSLTKSENHGSDISPPRKRIPRNDTPSPEPAERADADSSPPRKSRRVSGGRPARHDTPSPEQHGEDTDLSPPRRQQSDKHASSPEPGRSLHHKAANDSDMSPPRRARPDSRHQDRDLSPPRRQQRDKQASLVEPGGISPPRRATSVSDLSPPRRKPKDSDNQRAGLFSGKDIRKQINKEKKDSWLSFKKMDPSVSGRDAEAIYRDKTGKRMSKEEYLKSQKKEEKPKEIKLEWGKGLAQKREAEARIQEMEEEKDKPFARSRDDPDIDAMLKDRVRWGDPMAHLAKKKQLDALLPNLGDSERMKESGFIIPQEVPTHSWIRRGIDATPNRYGIKPGRHWDGVDRSTGYEKELFKRTNDKRATEAEAYLWSVADM
ncbi:BUD13 homolog [Salvia splendens]|uniref:BUD13 homolog n=1 Tax=Salvia splendens TaxID=180675 RepID=UPI001C265C91|nr:BUD13 homolog [Salvia splendens]XP_042065938.1 BUD13 homolog [Salvia splendens]